MAGFDQRDGLIDAAGGRHRPAGGAARIVSLVPSVTELLFDLGLGDAVVGRTAFCVHPRGRVRRARSVGGTKRVDLDRLASLRPSHVIVNVDETPRRLYDALVDAGYAVVVTHPVEVGDNLALYRLMGDLFGRPEAAEDLCRRLESELAASASAARLLPPRRVLYLIWKQPWMTVSRDTYISRMLALVGWSTQAHDDETRYPAIELSDALLASCDLVLFSSEPFPFTERHVERFRGEWPAHAAKALRIDGQMVSWYGSRAIASLAYLRGLAEEIAVSRAPARE